MVRTPRRKIHDQVSVTKTLSMPLDLLNAVAAEAEIMGKSISEATQTLVRIGLSIRQDQRAREDENTQNAIKSAPGREDLDRFS